MQRSIFSFGFGALFLLSGCVSSNFGNLGFDDNESPIQPDSGLYAVGDVIVLQVSILDGALNRTQVSQFQVISTDEAVLVAEPTLTDTGDGTFDLFATVVGAGSAQIQVKDGGNIVDSVDIQTAVPAGVEIEPLRFGGLSGFVFQDGDNLNIFDTGDAFISTRLLEDPSNSISDLKGQIPGIIGDEGILADNPVDVIFLGDEQFQIGERFVDGLFDLVPDSKTFIHGDNPGLEVVTLADQNETFFASLNVNVVPLDINAFTLDSLVPDTSAGPVSGGFLGGAALDLAGQPIFGGHYVFSEVTPNLDLIDIIPAELTDDFASFSVKASGQAQVQIDLVDPDTLDINGNPSVVSSEIVAFDVIAQ